MFIDIEGGGRFLKDSDLGYKNIKNWPPSFILELYVEEEEG